MHSERTTLRARLNHRIRRTFTWAICLESGPEAGILAGFGHAERAPSMAPLRSGRKMKNESGSLRGRA